MGKYTKRHCKLGILMIGILLFSVTAFGCGNDEQEKDAVKDPVVVAPPANDPAPSDNPGDQPPTEPEQKTEEPSPEDLAEAILPSSALFSYEEIAGVFDLNTEAIVKRLGEPKEIQEFDFFGSTGKEYIYDDASFSLGFFDEEMPEGMVFKANMNNDTIPAPRGIKIGDSLDSVIKKFPQTAEKGTREQSPDNEDNVYEMLYGEYMYMTDYGYIEYANDKPINVVYANEGIIIGIQISDDKVVGYHYAMPTT